MFGDPDITILCVNRNTEFVQILYHGNRYTCVAKQEHGEMLFRFKEKWYPVEQFTNKNTLYFG